MKTMPYQQFIGCVLDEMGTFVYINNTVSYCYIQSHILPVKDIPCMRSSGTGMLTPRRVKCSFGEKAFATCAPVLWNALPSNARNAKSLESFKSAWS